VSQQSCKVLVVDDNQDSADSTVMLLQIWGHEAVAAYSAERAISTARSFDPDVVLMDIGMPEMDGFDIAKELRTFCPDVRVVAITGFTQADIVRRSREAGFNGVLVKPAETKALKEVVDTQCAADSTSSRR
jgi:CheY-like chemotaxis protein